LIITYCIQDKIVGSIFESPPMTFEVMGLIAAICFITLLKVSKMTW
jgi:hypothetical protein